MFTPIKFFVEPAMARSLVMHVKNKYRADLPDVKLYFLLLL